MDYGEGPMVRDPHTGKYKRTRLFVLTLGFSRKCVRLLVFRSSSQTWAELHEKAFRRLGGVTRIVVLATCAKESSLRIFTIRRSILFIRTCWRITELSRCRAGCGIRIERAR